MTAVRNALAVDGELAGCDSRLPSRFLRHAWAVVQGEKARAARARIEGSGDLDRAREHDEPARTAHDHAALDHDVIRLEQRELGERELQPRVRLAALRGLEHRVGGLEKADGTGTISYDPDNHDHMVRLRQAKVDGIDVPPLEVDDPSLGAQPAEEGMTFRGATYDPRDDRLEIMLGDQGAGASHLTHAVEHPDGLAVASSDPQHSVLRITHCKGQTLLTVG